MEETTPPGLTRRAFLTAVAGLAAGAAACGRTGPLSTAATRHHRTGARPGGRPGTRPGAAARHTTEVDGVELPAAGWVSQENARTGTPGWGVPAGQLPHAIEGYLGAVSAVSGETVPLFVNTRAASFTVEAYRIGFYSGVGARLVWRGGPYPGQRQLRPAPTPGTNMVECRWSPATRVEITRAWVPGVYLLKLIGSGGEQQFVPLTVRDDTSTAAYAVTNAVTTWQAYNRWGGYSLYLGADGQGASFADRARVVSYDRPYTVEFGNGAGDLLGNELPLVMLLERHGLDVTYWTDIDLDQRPQLLARRGALLSLGHDEYWSATMYTTALAARDAGVNLAFFGANACYRHIRLDPGPNGPARRQVCYKIASEDPLYGVDNAAVTSNWYAPPDPRPESRLTGAMYIGFPADAGFQAGPTWLFAGSGMTTGDSLTGLVGSEFDGVDLTLPFPPQLDVLAHSPLVCRGAPGHSDATWYTVPGGGGVFDSGTALWIGRLAQATGPALEVVPSATPGVTVPLTRLTLNVLHAVGSGPAARILPSRGTWRALYANTAPQPTYRGA